MAGYWPLYAVASLWALVVVASSQADRRTKQIVREVKRQGEADRRQNQRQGPR